MFEGGERRESRLFGGLRGGEIFYGGKLFYIVIASDTPSYMSLVWFGFN